MGLGDLLTESLGGLSDTAPGRMLVRSRLRSALADAAAGKETDTKIPKNRTVRRVVLEESSNMLQEPETIRQLQEALRRLANKQASFADIYQEHIGRHPLRDIAATSALGAAGAYALSGPALSILAKLGGLGSPQLAAMANQYMSDPRGAGSAKFKLALLGALAGAGYGAYKHVDMKTDMEGMKQSLTDPNYWYKHPWQALRRKGLAPESDIDMAEMLHIDKQASDPGDPDDTYYDDSIYVPNAIHAVQRDPVLLSYNKRQVSGIVRDSGDAKKQTSGYRITNAALRAGVSYGAAWALGQGLGSVLNLPQPIVNRLSTAGGIAAAVVGSGVLKEL
jgi:hypothetical protein